MSSSISGEKHGSCQYLVGKYTPSSELTIYTNITVLLFVNCAQLMEGGVWLAKKRQGTLCVFTFLAVIRYNFYFHPATVSFTLSIVASFASNPRLMNAWRTLEVRSTNNNMCFLIIQIG